MIAVQAQLTNRWIILDCCRESVYREIYCLRPGLCWWLCTVACPVGVGLVVDRGLSTTQLFSLEAPVTQHLWELFRIISC
jgi:hypothetical protein